MSVKFSYVALPTPQPVPSLAGASVRHRPIIPVRLESPYGTIIRDCSLDSGCDDTIFPKAIAKSLGIDLSGLEQGQAKTITGQAIPYVYAQVTLSISDGFESCSWQSLIGFIDQPIHWPLLGHAGFLQFFDIGLFGSRREAVFTPNSDFTGNHVIHKKSP